MSDYPFEEIIPTVRFGNVHIQAKTLDELKEVSQAVRNDEYFQGLIMEGNVKEVFGPTGPSEEPTVVPVQAQIGEQPAPVGDNKTKCAQCGGEMKYNEGIGKQSGKPFKGYFCQKKGNNPECKNVSWVR